MKIIEQPDPRHLTLSPPLEPAGLKWVLLIFYLNFMLIVGFCILYYYLCRLVLWLVFLLPLEILGLVYLSIIFTALLVKIAISILDKKCPPREGLFKTDSAQIRYYKLKSYLKHYAIWFARFSISPWVDKIIYNMLGVPVGQTVVLHEAWVDTELVEIGDYCMIGMGSIVCSHMQYKEHVYIKGISIKSHTIIGAYSLIPPGSEIGGNCVIGANSTLLIGQKLKDGDFAAGVPARVLKSAE
ncbi:MAG: acyltransferase [Promethearchaeota archaeon]